MLELLIRYWTNPGSHDPIKAQSYSCMVYNIWYVHQTHLPCTKWPPFRRRYFEMHFREWFFFCILIKISLKFVPEGPVDNNPALVYSDDGLAPNRRQTIIWTNADQSHWRIYAALGERRLFFLLRQAPRGCKKSSTERRETSLEEAFPYLEFLEPGISNGLEDIKSLPKPRLIKSHLQSSYFKRQIDSLSICPKFVVVMRNPKDVLTSYYHFHKMFQGDIAFPKDWGYFFGMFQEKRLEYGDCFEHMVGWWRYRNHPRVLVVKYDDMKEDLKGNISESRRVYWVSESLQRRVGNYCRWNFF